MCQCDKSGLFAFLSRQQYIDAGKSHTDNDTEITMDEFKAIERNLNGHMMWWASMTGLGQCWNQEGRALRNLLNHGLAVCPMTLLVKDHKLWPVGETPPTRSIMGGN